jgi:hypothetical protein
MSLADHPDVPFHLARGFVPGRPDGPVLWWVLHEWLSPDTGFAAAGLDATADLDNAACPGAAGLDAAAGLSGGHIDSAPALAHYFGGSSGDQDVSAHYCFDRDIEIQCVRLRDCARMVGNRPGDRRGIGALLVGFGYYQSEAEWLDEPGRRTLCRVARVAARDLERYRIPARWCTPDDLSALRPGLTTRHDLRQAFGDDPLADPEPSFPREYLLARIRSEKPLPVEV